VEQFDNKLIVSLSIWRKVAESDSLDVTPFPEYSFPDLTRARGATRLESNWLVLLLLFLDD
jgi:hypothetical protein